jgi:hypothetical protein
MYRIQTNEPERILVTALNSSNAFLTGLTNVLLEVQRKSDGYYFDFDDETFKVSGWVTRQKQMTELDSVNSPGTYYYDFDGNDFVEGVYFVRATSATAANSPWENELHVGGFIDYLDGSIADVQDEVDKIQTIDDNVDLILTEANKIQGIDDNVDDVLTELADKDAFKADVSGLATEANAVLNTASIISEVNENEGKIDSVLSGIGGLATEANATLNVGTIVGEIDENEAKIDSVLSGMAGLATEANATINANAIIAEVDDNEAKIDTVVSGISGLATEENATTNTETIVSEIDASEVKIDSIITSLGLIVSNIWTYSTRTLSSVGTLVSDIWSATTRTLTAGTKDEKIDDIYDEIVEHRSEVEDRIKYILGLTYSNARIIDPVYSGANLVSATIKIYDSPEDAENDENSLKSWGLEATYDVNGLMTSYLVKENE